LKNYILSITVGVLLCACGMDNGNDLNENSNVNVNKNNDGVCGDGVINTGEDCDEGSANSDVLPNACRTNCRFAWCGDGVIDTDEQCDNSTLAGNSCVTRGYTKGTLECSPVDCTFDVSDCSYCGNDTAEGSDIASLGYETCDGSDLRGQTCLSIGQAQGTLACSDTCGWDISGCVGGGAVCGNGVVEDGEECDDGNHVLTDACPDGPGGTCLDATCGDGFVQAGVEGCDDGNGMNGDLCPDGVGGTCQLATCGDGHVFAGVELCDIGSDPMCHPGCLTYCGDGIHQGSQGEKCDWNDPEQISCYSDCSGYCGDGLLHDGVLYPDHGEECDGGSNCDPDCTFRVCGDGYCDGFFENHTNCPQDCP